ncbi:amidohydrolase family protein [Sediminispirochaeta bajacaliforniensis]|uniref:amidohydrolase family protein n=1 Tax=Sediminispirochaeta bajacaliforniensis TaxID=148 RepID=UPI000380B04D|nr:amidohydrolase family protein [Sediminispirochaeta bajacaliforniensis]
MLLKNGNIYTAENDCPIEADMVISDGRIEEIAQKIPDNGTYGEVLDLQGKALLPGFIDISTCLGIVEAGKRIEETNQTDKTNRFTPNFRMIDGVYWQDDYFRKAAENGVTTVVVNSKYESPLGGQSCAVKTGGEGVTCNRILSSYIDMHGTLGNRVKNNYDTLRVSPLSRMGIMRGIRDVLLQKNTREPGSVRQRTSATSDVGEDGPIRSLMTKDKPLKMTASLFQDIQALIDLSDELGIRVILDEGTESYMLIDELKERMIPVVLGSLLEETSREELSNRRDDIGVMLEKAGLPFCFSTHHPHVSIELYHMSACLHIRNGVSETAALKAMTIHPAAALGLSDRIGSLRKGKDADILVFDGDPFRSLTPLLLTIINGRVIYENRKRD